VSVRAGKCSATAMLSRNRGMFSRATLRYALANTSKSRAPKPLLCSAHISKPHKAGCYVAQEHSVCYAVFAGITKMTTQSVDLRWLRLQMRKSFCYCYCYCEPQAPFPGRGCGGWAYNTGALPQTPPLRAGYSTS